MLLRLILIAAAICLTATASFAQWYVDNGMVRMTYEFPDGRLVAYGNELKFPGQVHEARFDGTTLTFRGRDFIRTTLRLDELMVVAGAYSGADPAPFQDSEYMRNNFDIAALASAPIFYDPNQSGPQELMLLIQQDQYLIMMGFADLGVHAFHFVIHEATGPAIDLSGSADTAGTPDDPDQGNPDDLNGSGPGRNGGFSKAILDRAKETDHGKFLVCAAELPECELTTDPKKIRILMKLDQDGAMSEIDRLYNR